MTARPVVLRERAERDIEDALDWYRLEAGERFALRFVDAIEHALGRIALHPAIGSPRYAHALDLPGLRTILLTDFPYAIFYVDVFTHVDVWRVLHAERDLPEALRED
jgi:toxin ParE1/3/4